MAQDEIALIWARQRGREPLTVQFKVLVEPQDQRSSPDTANLTKRPETNTDVYSSPYNSDHAVAREEAKKSIGAISQLAVGTTRGTFLYYHLTT